MATVKEKLRKKAKTGIGTNVAGTGISGPQDARVIGAGVISGPKDAVVKGSGVGTNVLKPTFNTPLKRDVETVGYTKKTPRQMVRGGSFGRVSNINRPPQESASPQGLLTLDNAPRGMGWQERAALNKQILSNAATAGTNANLVTIKGMEGKNRLDERGIQESGLGRRQTQRLDKDTVLQDDRQAFTTRERGETEKYDTSERIGKQEFLADEAFQNDVRGALAQGHAGGVNPLVTKQGFNDSRMGFTNFGEAGDAVPNKTSGSKFYPEEYAEEIINGKKLQRKIKDPSYWDEENKYYTINDKGEHVPYGTGQQGIPDVDYQDESYDLEGGYIGEEPLTPAERKRVNDLKNRARKY